MEVETQIVANDISVPSESELRRWCLKALEIAPQDATVVVRVVDEDEGRKLNERWRHRNGATNVLAFPMDEFDLEPRPLGDVVICAAVANREAGAEIGARTAHWAHLVVHGTLHLLGYDHIVDTDAEVMESVERKLLAELGYPDPYL